MKYSVTMSGETLDPPPLMVDITQPMVGVQVMLIPAINGRVLHVNVDGVCVLRICRIPATQLEVDGELRDL